MTALRRIWKQSRAAFGYVVDLEFNRRFPEWPGSYRGVFSSFDEARASAPSSRPVGYDHPELAKLYDARMDKAFPSDYPALFWLLRLRPEVSSLFDWGGHIGISYYAYNRYLQLPEGFRWCVGDVPAIIEAGRKLAESKGAKALSFTSEIADADGYDVFFANGVLQYVDTPLADSLRRLARRPPHLLVNKLPAAEGPGFVTLENTVHAFNPYRVFNRAEFVASISALGYELVDKWETPDVTLTLPLHRERSLHAYSGFYFRAKAPD
jgi:putative methyltransferase (TIGR04325 family)